MIYDPSANDLTVLRAYADATEPWNDTMRSSYCFPWSRPTGAVAPTGSGCGVGSRWSGPQRRLSGAGCSMSYRTDGA